MNGGVNGFDHFKVSIVTAGGVVTQIIGPAAGNYVTAPFAPAYGLNAITGTTSGYGAYNSWDMGTGGTHTLAMAVGYNASPWWTKSYALAAFAGQTVTLRIETGHVTAYRSWASVDDVEWSVVNATLGAPQGFGVNITSPAAASNTVPGQALPITVQIDALPTGATNPVTAAIFDAAGTLLASGFLLYNDGTHGDAVAGDAIWSNNNSVVAQPAPTVPLSAPIASNYVLRVFARDASTSSLGAQNGLVRGPGSGAAAETQANFWNIDEILFNVSSAAISFTKLSMPISDPVNGTVNPKAIPGATVQYCLLISNAGPLPAANIVVTDTLPATLTYVGGSMRSGTSCATATTVEDDDNSGADESDPFGASQSSGTIIAVLSSILNGAVTALVFNTLIQ